MQFIQRILSEVGIYWRTMMDDVRGLDTYILADSQLNYQFDVQLPYSEPSGLFDGAAESVLGLPYTEHPEYWFKNDSMSDVNLTNDEILGYLMKKSGRWLPDVPEIDFPYPLPA